MDPSAFNEALEQWRLRVEALCVAIEKTGVVPPSGTFGHGAVELRSRTVRQGSIVWKVEATYTKAEARDPMVAMYLVTHQLETALRDKRAELETRLERIDEVLNADPGTDAKAISTAALDDTAAELSKVNTNACGDPNCDGTCLTCVVATDDIPF